MGSPANPREAFKTCPMCGEQILAVALKCKHCGSTFSGLAEVVGGNQQGLVHPSDPPKDPLLMGLLSGCCIAGLGQMILGQVAKGVVILLGAMVIGALTAGVGILVTWPLGGIDAYLVAKKLKDGKSVGQWEFF